MGLRRWRKPIPFYSFLLPDNGGSKLIHLMTVTTNERGQQNIFAVEPQITYTETNMTEFAEKLNGRLAMLGIIAALGSYALTGDLIPGIW